MSNLTEKVYFVRYTCRTCDGHIVEQFDDKTNLVGSWSEANKLMQSYVEVFNVDCKKGIWRGVIKTL